MPNTFNVIPPKTDIHLIKYQKSFNLTVINHKQSRSQFINLKSVSYGYGLILAVKYIIIIVKGNFLVSIFTLP